MDIAAESRNDDSRSKPWPFVQTNVIDSHERLEAVRRHEKRHHHTSIEEVSGDLELDDQNHFTLDTPHNPSNRYPVTKAVRDLSVPALEGSFGVQGAISNSVMSLGPFQRVEKLIARHYAPLRR